MRLAIRFVAAVAALGLVAAHSGAPAQAQVITLNGAVQFNDDHAFNKALLKFEELVKKYYGKPINFVLHRNSSLGLEKQYFEYMAQGKAVDYAIVSPAHMSTFEGRAIHRRAVPFPRPRALEQRCSTPICSPVADEINEKAEVMLIGYAGGGTRNIFVNKPVHNLAETQGAGVRVQGRRSEPHLPGRRGMAPTVIAYNEVYNAIQNNVISAGENEAAGVEAMKFYEVAPHLAMTEHAITIRPISLLDQDPSKSLPKDLQDAIVKAGGSGRLRPASRILRRHRQARCAGEGRQAQARPVRGPGGDEEDGRSCDGGLRQGDRRGQDLHGDQRDEVSAGRLRLDTLRPGAFPGRFVPSDS
jgi:TRAP-type C4-dicarboxylate transport system substrate-binding protein